MNEKQKQESGQVNPADKTFEKDYSKYFEAVYIPPSLKDAKNGAKNPFNIITILKSQKNLKASVKAGNFISARTDAK